MTDRIPEADLRARLRAPADVRLTAPRALLEAAFPIPPVEARSDELPRVTVGVAAAALLLSPWANDGALPMVDELARAAALEWSAGGGVR